jgi:hypothetical protein
MSKYAEWASSSGRNLLRDEAALGSRMDASPLWRASGPIEHWKMSLFRRITVAVAQ